MEFFPGVSALLKRFKGAIPCFHGITKPSIYRSSICVQGAEQISLYGATDDCGHVRVSQCTRGYGVKLIQRKAIF